MQNISEHKLVVKEKARIYAREYYWKVKQKDPEILRGWSRDWKRKNRDRNRYLTKKSYLKKTYGLTYEQYLDLIEDQNGECAICREFKELHIDHCHKTGKIRALLCPECNKVLGLAKEKIDILQSMIVYIDKFKE